MIKSYTTAEGTFKCKCCGQEYSHLTSLYRHQRQMSGKEVIKRGRDDRKRANSQEEASSPTQPRYAKQNSEERAQTVSSIFQMDDEVMNQIYVEKAYEAIMKNPTDQKLVHKIFKTLNPVPKGLLHQKFLSFEEEFSEYAKSYERRAKEFAKEFEDRYLENEDIKAVLNVFENGVVEEVAKDVSKIDIDASTNATASSSTVQYGVFNTALNMFGINQSKA